MKDEASDSVRDEYRKIFFPNSRKIRFDGFVEVSAKTGDGLKGPQFSSVPFVIVYDIFL